MFLKKLLVLIMLLTLAVPFTSYAQDTAEESQSLFIGTVTGIPDEFVGLAVDGESVTFYICDGQADKGTVSIAEWFVGSVADNLIDIANPSGNHVVITLDGETATGTLTFADGTVKEFVMTIADGEAALFRSDFKIGELDYVGGWLILADGTVRGAIFVPPTNSLFPASFVGFRRFFDPIDPP
jgi:hypothetical protein